MNLVVTLALMAAAVALYVSYERRRSARTRRKLAQAREYGLHEPVSIHPYVDPMRCIGSAACIEACPEKDILGLVNGRAVAVNAARCIGHGACAAACPTSAITLVFGSARRGVDIPAVSPEFETNVRGIFICGELGGMGLIRNAITQGSQAIGTIAARRGAPGTRPSGLHDVVIVGAGPAGIAASLAARQRGLAAVTIEQDEIGGSVLHYPRHKIVLTAPVELPLYGRVTLKQTTKEALLELWADVLRRTSLEIRAHEKLESIEPIEGGFRVVSSRGEHRAANVVLAVGRRGTPRKLGLPGEALPKVSYRLLEPEQHAGQALLVVGGGDSAVEAALALADQPGNAVTLSYRGRAFSRIKPENQARLDRAVGAGTLRLELESEVEAIEPDRIRLRTTGGARELSNDYVYVFIGGELPTELLRRIGIRVETKFGRA